MQKVQEGQELIRIETATMGEDGYTITGKLINSTPGKQYRIRPGRNTRYNPEGTHIIATKSGVVCINNDNISVEKLKVIDWSTILILQHHSRAALQEKALLKFLEKSH